MTTKIDLGDLQIRGSRRPGDSGLVIKARGFQGWEGLPAVRREALARALQLGEYDTPGYLPARIVTISGFIYAPGEHELLGYIDRVTGLGAGDTRLRAEVTHLGRQLHAYGRRVTADATVLPGALRADFHIQLRFPDPRRYGDFQRIPNPGTAMSVKLDHDGNFPAIPVFEFPDAPSSYLIESPAGTFTVTGATAGGTHRVDMSTGWVTRNGVHMSGVGRGPLWAIPPGEQWSHAFSTPGIGWVPHTYV